MQIQDIGCSQTFVAATPGTQQSQARALYIGTGGDLSVVDSRGETILFKNVGDGSVLPIAPRSINAETTASDIILLY